MFGGPTTGTKMATLTSSNMPRCKKGNSNNNQKREQCKAVSIGDVPILTLDSLLARNDGVRGGPVSDRNVSLLKMDVQGFELRVIQGAWNLLSQPNRVKRIQFEFSPLMISQSSSNKLAPLKLLELMRKSKKLCFTVEQDPHMKSQQQDGIADPLMIGFEDFVKMHYDPGAECPLLGCASEVVCLPFVDASVESIKPMLEDLYKLLECSSDQLISQDTIEQFAQTLATSLS
jgi:hypothetical protein